MNTKDRLFEPDYTKKKYSIVVDVYENAFGFKIELPNPSDTPPTYESAMGALEITKFNLINAQREKNIKAAKKQLKKKPKAWPYD